MAKYLVTVTVDTTSSTQVDVDAASEDAAKELALAEAHANPGRFEWVPDNDGAPVSDPYLADPDDCVELSW